MSSQGFRENSRGRRGLGRGWRGRGSSHASPTPHQQPRANESFGPRIDSFHAKTLLIEDEAPEIKDVRYIGSYNWLNATAPIILVPGQSCRLHFPRHLLPTSTEILGASADGYIARITSFNFPSALVPADCIPTRLPTSMDTASTRREAPPR